MRSRLLPPSLVIAACSVPAVEAPPRGEDLCRVSEAFQELCLAGAEECDRLLSFISGDVVMVENDEEWGLDRMVEYGPFLPCKQEDV